MNTISKGLSLCVILVVAWGIQKAMTTPPVGMNTNDYLEFGALISEAGRASVALTFYQKAALLDETNLVARVKLLYLEGDMLRESGRPTEAMLKYKAAAVIQNADAKSRSSWFIVHSLISTSATPQIFFVGKDARFVEAAYPPAQITYSIPILSNQFLQISPALSPEVWQPGKGDGAQFDIYIDDGYTKQHPFSKYIDPKNIPADRKWHDHEIDLSPWAGQTVTLTFATDCGPNNDCRYDWAGWGEPRIVQPVAYNFLTELPNADHGGADDKQVRQDTLTIDSEPRAILFQHPSNWVTYRVTMPQQAMLHFGLGIDPAVWSPDKGDGVEYNLYVRKPDEPYVLYQVFSRYVDPKNNPEDRRWLDLLVDLSDYSGQTVDIIFEASPGPAGNANFDWGGWSNPVLVANGVAPDKQEMPTAAGTSGDKPYRGVLACQACGAFARISFHSF